MSLVDTEHMVFLQVTKSATGDRAKYVVRSSSGLIIIVLMTLFSNYYGFKRTADMFLFHNIHVYDAHYLCY